MSHANAALVLAAVLAPLGPFSCSRTTTGVGPVSVVVVPSEASLTTGSTQQFAAAVAGAADSSVAWSVNEGAAGGAISSAGLYTAAAQPGTFRVRATPVAAPDVSATATVTVCTPVVAVTIAPKAANVLRSSTQTFAAFVSGSSNPAVTWSVQEGAAGGSVVAGVYTAPAADGTFHVVVTSQADTSKSDAATVTVTAAPLPVIASFTASPAAIAAGAPSTLAWSVTGATSLSIDPGVGAVTGTSQTVTPAPPPRTRSAPPTSTAP